MAEIWAQTADVMSAFSWRCQQLAEKGKGEFPNDPFGRLRDLTMYSSKACTIPEELYPFAIEVKQDMLANKAKVRFGEMFFQAEMLDITPALLNKRMTNEMRVEEALDVAIAALSHFESGSKESKARDWLYDIRQQQGVEHVDASDGMLTTLISVIIRG